MLNKIFNIAGKTILYYMATVLNESRGVPTDASTARAVIIATFCTSWKEMTARMCNPHGGLFAHACTAGTTQLVAIRAPGDVAADTPLENWCLSDPGSPSITLTVTEIIVVFVFNVSQAPWQR